MILEARPPFDFAKSLAFVSSFAPGGGEQRIDGERLRKAFEVDGTCVLASVYPVDDASVDVWLDADTPLDEAQCSAAYDRVAFYLSLSDEVPAHPHAAGFHQVKFATPFEAACWAILTQRLAIPLARKIKDRICARWGTSIVRDGVRYRAFPSPSRLAKASDGELHAAGVPHPKLRYIRSAIEAFVRVDERWLRQAPAHEVHAWLRAIAGIGEWSAHLVLIRGLGRMESDDYLRFYERALPTLA